MFLRANNILRAKYLGESLVATVRQQLEYKQGRQQRTRRRHPATAAGALATRRYTYHDTTRHHTPDATNTCDATESLTNTHLYFTQVTARPIKSYDFKNHLFILLM